MKFLECQKKKKAGCLAWDARMALSKIKHNVRKVWPQKWSLSHGCFCHHRIWTREKKITYEKLNNEKLLNLSTICVNKKEMGWKYPGINLLLFDVNMKTLKMHEENSNIFSKLLYKP